MRDSYNPRPKAIAHADQLAEVLKLNRAAAGWKATAENFLGRVTKGRILEAVREAKGDTAAEQISGLKKPEMITAAEELLAETGWLPEPLRTPVQIPSADGEAEVKTSSANDPEAADDAEKAADPEGVSGVAAE